jgi:hypothetical protein
MLQIRLHEIIGHFTSFLVLSILVFNMIIAYAPNAVEPAVAAKLDNPYSTNFNTVTFPSFLKFDPFEEYRHVVFDRTVTIMGQVLLNGTDNIKDTETSEHILDSPSRVQESQQLTDSKRIQTESQQRQSQMQERDRWQEPLQMTNQATFLGPIYTAPQPAIPEANNQGKVVSRSTWFPSVPSYFCDGEYSFVIRGTARLDLEKLKQADQYDVTIKILTDKFGLSPTEDHEGVTGILGIADHEDLQDSGIGRNSYSRENTRVISSSDVINDLFPDTGNLDIERIQNNCRVHVYNTH